MELAVEKLKFLMAIFVSETVGWSVNCAFYCKNDFIDVANKLIGRQVSIVFGVELSLHARLQVQEDLAQSIREATLKSSLLGMARDENLVKLYE